MTKIIVDCYGGDKSPDANIDGAKEALEELRDLQIVFTGRKTEIESRLSGADAARIEIADAPDVITCEEIPTQAIREKKNSSLMTGIRLLLSDDSAAGLVSTGSTGALVAAATLRVGRLRGVIRPAFCPVLPTMNGGVVGICDSGANISCSPDMLYQFAVMGSLYMNRNFGIESPRVALLNVGTEAEKGDDLRKETFGLLKSCGSVNFVGNAEGRDLLSGDIDLMVCDGFSGNVLIKATEGAGMGLMKKLKTDIYSRTLYKFGALFMAKMFREEKDFMDYRNYGGSVMLGTAKTIVKGHGSSNAASVRECIRQAYRMETGGLNNAIEEQNFEKDAEKYV